LLAAKAWNDGQSTWREQRDDAEVQPASYAQEQNEAGNGLPPSPAIPCHQAGNPLPPKPRRNLEKKPLVANGLSGGGKVGFQEGEPDDGEPTVDDGAGSEDTAAVSSNGGEGLENGVLFPNDSAGGEDVAIVDKTESAGLEDSASTFQASETVHDRRQQNFLLPFAGKSSKQVAENKAMQRWERELRRRLPPEAYGTALEVMTLELSAKATAAEMARKGSGVHAVLAGLEERQVAS